MLFKNKEIQSLNVSFSHVTHLEGSNGSYVTTVNGRVSGNYRNKDIDDSFCISPDTYFFIGLSELITYSRTPLMQLQYAEKLKALIDKNSYNVKKYIAKELDEGIEKQVKNNKYQELQKRLNIK